MFFRYRWNKSRDVFPGSGLLGSGAMRECARIESGNQRFPPIVGDAKLARVLAPVASAITLYSLVYCQPVWSVYNPQPRPHPISVKLINFAW